MNWKREIEEKGNLEPENLEMSAWFSSTSGWIVIIIAWGSVETGLRRKHLSFVMQKAKAERSCAVTEEEERILAQAL